MIPRSPKSTCSGKVFSGASTSRVEGRWIKLSNINRVKYLEGSGVAVKKWMQGRLVSLGRIDTMLPVVQKPPESMQMPLALSLRIDIITSAVTDPETTQGTEKVRQESSTHSYEAHDPAGFSVLPGRILLSVA